MFMYMYIDNFSGVHRGKLKAMPTSQQYVHNSGCVPSLIPFFFFKFWPYPELEFMPFICDILCMIPILLLLFLEPAQVPASVSAPP